MQISIGKRRSWYNRALCIRLAFSSPSFSLYLLIPHFPFTGETNDPIKPRLSNPHGIFTRDSEQIVGIIPSPSTNRSPRDILIDGDFYIPFSIRATSALSVFSRRCLFMNLPRSYYASRIYIQFRLLLRGFTLSASWYNIERGSLKGRFEDLRIVIDGGNVGDVFIMEDDIGLSGCTQVFAC